MKYWQECISEAFDEAGITATSAQIAEVSKWVEGAHENFGTSHGYDSIPNPMRAEIKELKEKLYSERDKVVCKECWGSGRIISHGPSHGSNTQCHKCNGDGKIAG